MLGHVPHPQNYVRLTCHKEAMFAHFPNYELDRPTTTRGISRSCYVYSILFILRASLSPPGSDQKWLTPRVQEQI
jgi:hypothetical protein